MMTASACLWLGFFPILQMGTYAHITADKWTIMLALTAFTLLYSLIETVLIRKDGIKLLHFRPAPVIMAAVLLACILLSCLQSEFPSDSWWIGMSRRREGLLTQLCYLGLFFMFAFSRVRRTPVLCCAASGVLVFLVVVLLQRAGVNAFGLYPFGRSYATNPEFLGTIGNIDMDTGYLVLMSGLFLAELIRRPTQLKHRNRKPHARDFFVIGMMAAGLAATVYLIAVMEVQFGVIALGALVVFSVLFLLPRKWFVILLVLLLVLALAAVWFWPGHGGGVWELHEILHNRTQLSFGSNRVAVWTYSLGMAREDRLWTGGGADTFEFRFNRYLHENGLEIPKYQDGVALPDYFDTPHNEYIGHLVNHGLPAMVLFGAIILYLILKPESVSRRRAGLSPWAAAVLCYGVQAVFSFSICLVTPMFWVVAGLCAAEKERPV